MKNRRFRLICLALYEVFLSPLPNARFINWLKVKLLKVAGLKIGCNCVIEPGVVFSGLGEIVMGDNVWLCRNVLVQCDSRLSIGNGVEINYGTLLSANGTAELNIGDECHIAHFCSLKCSTQVIDNSSSTGSIVKGSEFKSIRVGNGCWVCSGVTILPGVCVGARNVVAAGAVVTKDSPDGVLLAGIPAVIKKKYQ